MFNEIRWNEKQPLTFPVHVTVTVRIGDFLTPIYSQVSSVHPTPLYCLELFTYHLHRYIVKCPPYIQHICTVLNSSLITYTDIQSSVLRTSNTSLLFWTLHLSLTPIYSQVSSVHPTHLYCFKLFTYHLHRYIAKCPPYSQHICTVLQFSIITHTQPAAQ
jgi:hypothetical protein